MAGISVGAPLIRFQFGAHGHRVSIAGPPGSMQRDISVEDNQRGADVRIGISHAEAAEAEHGTVMTIRITVDVDGPTGSENSSGTYTVEAVTDNTGQVVTGTVVVGKGFGKGRS